MKTDFNFDSEAPSCRLDELPAGEDAEIISVESSGPAGHRLLDMGVLPQTSIRLLRRAPLGDPAVYELRGYQLCLRRREAQRVEVRRLRPDTPDPR